MNKSGKKNILFINDGSTLNPIIHSQGLPLLESLSGTYNCIMLSFEYPIKSQQEKDKFNSIIEKYRPHILFKEVDLKNYFHIPFLLVFFCKGIPQTFRLVKRYNIKLIHARSLFPAIISLAIKFFLPGTKILYDNRGVLIEELVFTGVYKRGGFRERLMSYLENLVIKKSDHIVVVSNVFKKYLQKKYLSIKSLSEKISVVNNKTNINNKFNYEEIIERKSKEKITCIYSGSSAKWQNVEQIFSFVQKGLSVFDNFSFKILTYHTEEFKKKLTAFPELLPVTIILEVNSDQVFNEMTSANFGILLRDDNVINNVSSPLKFAEYLTAGLPVVVSKGVGDTDEIINKYNVGVIIKNNDYETAISEIKELLKDPGIYSRCRFVAEKEFNLQDSFKAYESVYNTLL